MIFWLFIDTCSLRAQTMTRPWKRSVHTEQNGLTTSSFTIFPYLIIMIVKSFTLHYLIATWRNHCCFMLYLYKKWMHVEAYDSLYISHTAVCYLPKQPELVTMANWPNLTHNKINMKQNFLRGSLFCDLSQGRSA